jgi:thioredoxin reductase (NADPH)
VWRTDCTAIDFSRTPYRLSLSNCTVEADSIVIATGAEANWLNAPNEQFYRGRGISTCATCDGFFFKNKSVLVVGGGDSAFEEAIFLSKIARNVTLIHRGEKYRASKVFHV